MSTIAALRSAFQRTPETPVTELPGDDGGERPHARAQALLLELIDRCLRGVRIGFEIGERSFTLGRGEAEPLGVLRLRDASVCTRVLAAGNLGLGEAYMDGAVTVVRGDKQVPVSYRPEGKKGKGPGFERKKDVADDACTQ